MPSYKIPPKARVIEHRKELEQFPPHQVFRAAHGTYQKPREDGLNGSGYNGPEERTSNTYIPHTYIQPFYEYDTSRRVNRNTDAFRVKNTHSNEWTNLEIMAAKYAGLSGIAVPWTVFGVDVEKDNPALAKACEKRKDFHTKPKDIPFYFVASQRLKGYQDFSTFLDYAYNTQLDYFFPADKDPEKRNKFIKNYQELQELRNLPHTHYPENKLKKRDLMLDSFRMLPQELQDMVDEAYVVSAWIGNWDMFNQNLTNTGFTVLHQADGSVLISPAMIDLGNCLYAGFSGKYKKDCFEIANNPAKSKESNPHDFDPPIPDDQKILKNAVIFNSIPGIALGTIPRRWPFADLFKENDKKIIECLENRRSETGKLSKGFLRGLYRISRISNSAIEKVGANWFHMGKGINYSSTNPKDHYTQQDLTKTMLERKDNICKTFTKEIQQYTKDHPHDVELTKREVVAATLDVFSENDASELIRTSNTTYAQKYKNSQAIQNGSNAIAA